MVKIKKELDIGILKHLVDLLNSTDVNKLRKKVKYYNSLDKNKISYTKIRNLFNDTMSDLATLVKYDYVDNNGEDWYRARIINNVSKVYDFKYPDSYWEPPKLRVLNYGRLHSPNENLLYLADNPKTALDEVRAKKGDIVVLSKFKVNRRLNNIINLLFVENIDHQINYINSRNVKINSNGIIALKAYANFFNDIFYSNAYLKNDMKYIQTNLVIHPYFDAPTTQGWIYKSVQTGSGTFNLCLKPEFAHKNLSLQSSILIRIDELPKNKLLLKFSTCMLRPKGESTFIKPSGYDNHYYSSLLNKLFPEISFDKSLL